MNKFIYLCFAIALTFLITSCCPPSSIHPLSSPKEAQYEKKLEGTWYYKEGNGRPGYFHIGRAKENLTKAIVIEQDGSLGFSVLMMFPTVISENNFLNIKIKQVDEEFPHEHNGYFFAKYQFTGDDSLLISLMDIDGFAKGIQDGKIKGEITYKKPATPEGSKKKQQSKESKVINCLKITDESENIVKFIKDSNIRDLFPKEFKLKRLKIN